MNILKSYIQVLLIGILSLANNVNAYADDVTLGTSTSNYGYSIPYNTGYKYSTSEMLYTPSEIGGPARITAIAFQVRTASSLATSSVRIYMGHSSGYLYSTSYLPYSSMTLVYSGSPTLAGSTGWNTISLTNSFEYNGTDNLVVVVCRSSSSTNTSQSFYYTYKSSSGYCLYRGGSTSTYASASSTTNFNTYYGRPNTKLTLTYNKITLNNITKVSHLRDICKLLK